MIYLLAGDEFYGHGRRKTMGKYGGRERKLVLVGANRIRPEGWNLLLRHVILSERFM